MTAVNCLAHRSRNGKNYAKADNHFLQMADRTGAT